MPFYYILLGLAASYVATAISDAYVRRAAALLSPEAQAGMETQTARWDLFSRLLDGLGTGLIIIGMLKAFAMPGLRNLATPYQWGLPLAALGLSLVCLERVLRAWMLVAACSKVPGAAPLRPAASMAALLITLVETALAVVVLWMVLTKGAFLGQLRNPPSPSRSKPSATSTESPESTSGETPGTEERVISHQWISGDEALKILERDQAFLDLLVPHQQIRTKVVAGIPYYDRNDITTIKRDGMPSLEELKAAAQERKKQE